MSPAEMRSRHSAQPYGEADRMIVFGEMLDTAMELLAEETLAKDRLALIAIDNLADLLLHRHAERVFASSEGSWAFPRRQYSSRERHQIRKQFTTMLRLAQVRADAPWGRHVDPILNESDATLVRVAHSYRNGVYHDDRHNRAVLSPLTALYAQAVGRAFAAGYPAGVAWSVTDGQAVALARLGAMTRPDEFTGQPMLEFRHAAQQIVDRLITGWEVVFDDFRAHLAADIHDRALAAARVIVELSENGMPDEALERVFWWSQFWEANGSDDELQRLDSERLAVARSDADSSVSDDQAAAEAERAYREHLQQLGQRFRPRVDLAQIPTFEKRASSLAQAKNMSILLDRYERLDAEVEALEKATAAALSAWQHDD